MYISSEAEIRDSKQILCVPVLRCWNEEVLADTMTRFAPSPVDAGQLAASHNMKLLTRALMSERWMDLNRAFASSFFFFEWMQRVYYILEEAPAKRLLGAIAPGDNELSTLLVAVLGVACQFLRGLPADVPWLARLVTTLAALGIPHQGRAQAYYLSLGFERPTPKPPPLLGDVG